MKVSNKKIAVCSRSFSKNNKLREELLSTFNAVKFNDDGKSLEGQSLIDFLGDAEAAIVALEKIDEKVLSQTSNLKFISKYGVGLDSIDFKALEKFNVKLGHTPGVNKRSVSELVLGYILNIYRKLDTHNHDLKKGQWRNQGGLQLTNKTVGIIGAGHVGRDLMSLLKPFQCKILFYDLIKMPELEGENSTQVALDHLLQQSDIVTVHIPYHEGNKFFINKENLTLMKSDALFINTSRGGIVDEEALYTQLVDKKLAGAAMDVYITEPAINHKLFSLHEFIGTPHVGGSSDEAILAMGRAAIANLVAYAEK